MIVKKYKYFSQILLLLSGLQIIYTFVKSALLEIGNKETCYVLNKSFLKFSLTLCIAGVHAF